MTDQDSQQRMVDHDLDQTLEQRADYIPLDKLRRETAKGDWFNLVHEALTDRGTKLLVGPRGCGKTHVMRYTWDACIHDNKLPFCLYISFNRYYRLEPLLRAKSNAVDLFHVWVLANILIGLFETVAATREYHPSLFVAEDTDTSIGFAEADVQSLIVKLERSLTLTREDQQLAEDLSVDRLKSMIECVMRDGHRKRAVLLLDDAALTLTPEYMGEFFDTVRALKTTHISFKASVYPGTTEYGSRFHALQEGDLVPMWLSVEDPSYSGVMGAIATTRIVDFEAIPNDVSELLKYAAFGIPRAYLSMLTDFKRAGMGTTQQNLNKIIQTHIGARIAEYRSLSKKVPRFSTLIERGEQIFRGIVRDIKKANEDQKDGNEKLLMLGVNVADEQPLVRRVFNLLIEAGLLYEHAQVSHGGPDRTYLRYTPHIAALLEARAFSGKDRGTSPAQIVSFLKRKPAKHPVRRSVSTLLSKEDLASLRLDLPPCSRCGTARFSDEQRFCHHCGAELLDQSTFYECMSLSIAEVPGMTQWQLNRMRETLPAFKTIGDVLAHQDPGTELRKIHQVGQRRAEKILKVITNFVEEFLS